MFGFFANYNFRALNEYKRWYAGEMRPCVHSTISFIGFRKSKLPMPPQIPTLVLKTDERKQ